MISVRELDLILSSKIGDIVTDNGDGILFKQSHRIEYIERAFNKTVRLLKLAMDKYAPLFVKRFYTVTYNSNQIQQSSIVFDKQYSTIEQITTKVVKETNKFYTVLAMRLEENKYLSTMLLETRNPSFVDKTIYYTLLNDKIIFLPEEDNEYQYYEVVILYTSDGIKINSINEIIPIERSYIDILLSFAAGEAMIDLGRSDKGGVFFDDAYSQIKILQNIAQAKERKAGNI